MCGIVGIVSGRSVSARLVEGLRRLEYRGYDSAGIATVLDGSVQRRRAVGKLASLETVLEAAPLAGNTGIGHTRWATHGKPTELNAHPHGGAAVAIVHNGIIENFSALRDNLKSSGISFESETDSEVIARLVERNLIDGSDPKAAFSKALAELHGAFALGAVFAEEPGKVFCARRGSPLAIGWGEDEMFIGSDALALAPFTREVTFLDEGDWAVIDQTTAEVFDAAGQPVERDRTTSSVEAALVGKGRHRHFMAKEIEEQSEVVAHTLASYLNPSEGTSRVPDHGIDFKNINRLIISACGTAYLAGLISKYWFESWARLPVEIDIASELRYRDFPYQEGDAAFYISQSGETADTLAAMRHAKDAGVRCGTVVNVLESTMAREADAVFPIKAGPEIGVASTKAFTCQLATLAAIALAVGRERGHLSAEDETHIVAELLKIPRLMTEVMAHEEKFDLLGQQLTAARDVLYLGRGVSFPLALEGALKLKEISYIHAEGYAAGELKHGPIALVDEDVPIIVIAPPDKHFDKTISNMHEVLARGGQCLLLSTKQGIADAKTDTPLFGKFELPEMHPMLTPLVYALPVQLLAYYTAVHKGTDVDQPRNLAKSVTVE